MKSTINSFIFVTILGFILVSACTTEKDNNSVINGKTIRSIYIESNGTKWFATEKGISSFDGQAWTSYSAKEGLPSPVNDLTPSATSGGTILWVSSNGGVVKTNLEDGSFTVENTFNTGNSDLMSDTVFAVNPDKAGYIWMGTNRGYNGLKNNNEWFKSSDFDIALPVTRIGSSDDGWNYFATLGGGIARNVSTVDGVTSASSYSTPWAGIPTDVIYSLYIEPVTGNQWFGTAQGAAYHIGTATKKNWTVYNSQNGLVNDFVQTIAGDAAGNIWFGTRGGVSRFADSTWTSYTKSDGLASNMVYAIAFDIDGSVWFGTDNGVSHLSSGTWASYH